MLIPQGKIAMGKLAQAVMHGAKIIQIDGNFGDCLELARKLTADYPTISLVNSVNPVRIEGQKTAAFGIVDVLGTAPPTCTRCRSATPGTSPPTGGYTEYHRAGLSDRLPRMLGTQAAGAAPLVLGHPVSHPETLATAIRIGSPASWDGRSPRRRSREENSWRPPTTNCWPPTTSSPATRKSRRARLGGQRGRAAQGSRGRLGQTRFDSGLHSHRARTEGPRHRICRTCLKSRHCRSIRPGGGSPGAGLRRVDMPVTLTLPPGLVASAAVAASSANLGPGFDSLGLALGLTTILKWRRPRRPGRGGRGQGAGEVSGSPDNLVVRAIRRGLEVLRASSPGLCPLPQRDSALAGSGILGLRCRQRGSPSPMALRCKRI